MWEIDEAVAAVRALALEYLDAADESPSTPTSSCSPASRKPSREREPYRSPRKRPTLVFYGRGFSRGAATAALPKTPSRSRHGRRLPRLDHRAAPDLHS